MRIAEKTGRQPKLVVMGLALVLACAAIGAEMARRGAHTTRFLEIAEAVPAGAPIESSDLTSTVMASPGNVDAVPASEASQVIGARAAATLLRGSLLVTADLLQGNGEAPGTALVGTSLQPDQTPGGLAIGDAVLLVQSGTGSPAGSTSAPTSVAPPTQQAHSTVMGRGTVFSMYGGGANGGVDITVEVPATVAAAIATASAAGDVSLVEVDPAARRASR